jgi:hypothetical protein
MNSDYAMSSSGRQGLALGAVTAIHYSVETELLASQLIDDIQVRFITLMEYYVNGKLLLLSD